MASPVKLKGDFDEYLTSAARNLEKFQHTLVMEQAKPNVWTKAQSDDLLDMTNAVADLWRAITEMAMRVRDD
jgi:hypothetical protein